MSIPFSAPGWRRAGRRFGPGFELWAAGGRREERPDGHRHGGHRHHHGGPEAGDPPFAPDEGPESGAGFGPGFGPGAEFGPDPDVGFGRGRGRGRRGPRFGPPFPPFPPGVPGFGPPFGGPRGRGRGGRRGNVRAAVLALLAEEPRHGYAIMNELAERSGGLWRPSPGSVYPVLQQLQDEGLVLVEEADGRRIFTLSEAGRTYVAEHADELTEPWRVADSGPMQRAQSIMASVGALHAAAAQVAHLADDEQAARAVAAIDEARKRLYRILAGETE